MSRIAQIKDGVVVNVIEAELEWAQEYASAGFDDVVPAGGAGPGWTWGGETFTAPPGPEPEPLPVGGMTSLAFTRRFTLAERISIRQSTDPIVVDGMAMLEVAEEIKLDDPDTVALIGYFVTQGLLTQERADEILEQET